MGRYIKRYGRIGMSLGPSEERGFALWVGYDLVDVAGDHSAAGLVAVDDWTPEQLAERGVIGFTRVEPDDAAQYQRLGLTHRAQGEMMEQHEPVGHGIRSVEEIARVAAIVAAELRRSAAATAAPGGGSIQRGLSLDIQSTFIDVRGALYERGIFDPVLARFDSATSAPASNGEIADQLDAIAQSLKR